MSTRIFSIILRIGSANQAKLAANDDQLTAELGQIVAALVSAMPEAGVKTTLSNRDFLLYGDGCPAPLMIDFG